MGLYKKCLSTGLKKTSHSNYVQRKVTEWNFLKKDSSVSYREASRLRPFWHPAVKPEFLHNFHGKVVKNSVVIKSMWFWNASPFGWGRRPLVKGILGEWCMWKKWADFEDLKITNAFLGFMWLELYCAVSLKCWVLGLNFSTQLIVAFGNRALTLCPGHLCWDKREQKTILFLSTHTVCALEMVSSYFGRRVHFSVPYTRCSNSAIITSLNKITQARGGSRWQP